MRCLVLRTRERGAVWRSLVYCSNWMNEAANFRKLLCSFFFLDFLHLLFCAVSVDFSTFRDVDSDRCRSSENCTEQSSGSAALGREEGQGSGSRGGCKNAGEWRQSGRIFPNFNFFSLPFPPTEKRAESNLCTEQDCLDVCFSFSTAFKISTLHIPAVFNC